MRKECINYHDAPLLGTAYSGFGVRLLIKVDTDSGRPRLDYASIRRGCEYNVYAAGYTVGGGGVEYFGGYLIRPRDRGEIGKEGP